MLNLTVEERKTIIFLALVLFIGLGFRFLTVKIQKVRIFISSSKDVFRIDLNTADKQMLMEVPGIGEKIAERIIEHRRDRGGFKNKEGLRNVKGITEFRYRKIQEYFR